MPQTKLNLFAQLLEHMYPYAFDKIGEILENDIYGYEWSFMPPF